jgi:hypothetical protein
VLGTKLADCGIKAGFVFVLAQSRGALRVRKDAQRRGKEEGGEWHGGGGLWFFGGGGNCYT